METTTKKWFYDLQKQQEGIAKRHSLELNKCLTQDITKNVVYELWSANHVNGDNFDILFMMVKAPMDRHFIREFIDPKMHKPTEGPDGYAD